MHNLQNIVEYSLFSLLMHRLCMSDDRQANRDLKWPPLDAKRKRGKQGNIFKKYFSLINLDWNAVENEAVNGKDWTSLSAL